MSDEKTPGFLTALFSFFPIGLLLAVDIYAMFLQPQAKALSHLALAVLTAQFLCSLVFIKGDLCNGQRARLSGVHGYFGLFWAVWLALSLFSNYHYVLTDMLCLCGMVMVLAARKQPQEARIRRSILMMGVCAGVLGVVCYLLMLADMPSVMWVQYNIIAQALAGVVLTNLALLTARNRLQGFIALLPLLMIVLLLLNAIAVLTVLTVTAQSAVGFGNVFAFMLYFVLHLAMAALLAVPVLRKTKADYPGLMILLTMAASLPLWSIFAYMR